MIIFTNFKIRTRVLVPKHPKCLVSIFLSLHAFPPASFICQIISLSEQILWDKVFWTLRYPYTCALISNRIWHKVTISNLLVWNWMLCWLGYKALSIIWTVFFEFIRLLKYVWCPYLRRASFRYFNDKLSIPHINLSHFEAAITNYEAGKTQFTIKCIMWIYRSQLCFLEDTTCFMFKAIDQYWCKIMLSRIQ